MERRSPFAALCSLVLTALLLTLWVAPAVAAVYACANANGDTQFQDRPCASNAPAQSAGGDTSKSAGKNSKYPLGMHASWFIAPEHAPQPAYCDRVGCDCASLTRNFRRGLTAAVADALFLEADWHRYAEQVIQMETNPPTGFAKMELMAAIEDSACNIQMSQLTVRNYAEYAMNDLESRAKAAIERGNVDYDLCDGSDAQVCADVDAVALLERVKLDIETLSLPRFFLIAEAD